ncbi:MAG: lamin tail domain-containing protein, partial [Bacteroidales bacterium]|nr:lamin tail domain-containing protein [Bacteroidales bacterium]
HDGAANDDVYGAKILPVSAATIVSYYIYAENNDAGMFSPEKAEFVTYTYQVNGIELLPGDLVINEFLADNDSTVPDQDGEYDDWIELYNNTADGIPLSGMYLSDNYNQPEKWIFPDTIIQANSFLIIWADEDGSQEGLHANFKLSKSGEEIMFSNFDGTVLDSITFGEQFADTSFGRYPNGTGDFVFMPPTFGLENQLYTYVSEIDYANYIKVYPNPASDFIMIKFTGSLVTEEIEIEVLDLFSRRYYQSKKISGETNMCIPVSEISPGIYLIRTGSYYQKIVIK